MKFSHLIIFCLFLLSCSNRFDIKLLKDAEFKVLPTGFYGYRYSSLYIQYLGEKKYRLWFETDVHGNPTRIFKIENFTDQSNPNRILSDFGVDTLIEKRNAQLFADLSHKHGFGHIHVDTIGKTYLSSINGLAEEYVKPFSDSLKAVYKNNKDFIMLKNGWFKNKRK
jgi:hypothetical protein